MEASKKAWHSKTMWLGLLTAMSPFVSGLFGWDLAAFLAGNAEGIAMAWGALAMVLRFVTKDSVKLLD